MNWIRVAVAIVDDPDIHRLALALGCRVAEAVGLVVCTLAKFPEHAPGGNLTDVPPTLVERWAGWDGERGVFDRALRNIFLNPEGVWVAWDLTSRTDICDRRHARAKKYYAKYRQSVYERDGFRCVVCASETDLTLDHIVPTSRGGEHTPDNLQTLCRPCNSRKGNRL